MLDTSSTPNDITIDLGERSYSIVIGAEMTAHAVAHYLSSYTQNRECFILADAAVQAFAEGWREALETAGAQAVRVLWLEGGEGTKAWSSYQSTCEWLLSQGLKRDSVLYAIGGGVIGDLAGFAAATVMRGVPFIQIPTTLLAQVDSSVGGKTGINTQQGKNLVGAFYQPRCVIADLDALKTLPEREIRAGYAEIVKYALINDPAFFTWLEEKGPSLCARDPEALAYGIQTSVKAKASIVQADERESGQRALLNLGHTFGHALEAAAGYDGRLLHGEAVAIGMVMAFETSTRMGLCSAEDTARVKAHIARTGLPVTAAQIAPAITDTAHDLTARMKTDKKADAHTINFILTRGIGQSFVTSKVDMAIVESVINDSLSA